MQGMLAEAYAANMGGTLPALPLLVVRDGDYKKFWAARGVVAAASLWALSPQTNPRSSLLACAHAPSGSCSAPGGTRRGW